MYDSIGDDGLLAPGVMTLQVRDKLWRLVEVGEYTSGHRRAAVSLVLPCTYVHGVFARTPSRNP